MGIRQNIVYIGFSTHWESWNKSFRDNGGLLQNPFWFTKSFQIPDLLWASQKLCEGRKAHTFQIWQVRTLKVTAALSCPESESRWGAKTEYLSWFPASQTSILPSTLSWAWSVRAAWPPEPSKKLRKHTEKEKYPMTSLTCGILKKKMIQINEFTYKRERDSQT